jgi:hypothetical protein
VDDWAAHASTTSHAARFAVCQELAAPEKNAAMMAQLWDHIRLDFNAVDDATSHKLRRRRRRLMNTVKYLVDSSVLSVQVIDVDGSGHIRVAATTPKFVMFGERAATADLTDRVARLFPSAAAEEIDAIVEYMTSPMCVGNLFDLLELSAVLVPASRATSEGGALAYVSDDAKRQLLLSMMGQLTLFGTRDRPTSVLNKADADQIVMHVLATHVIENTMSELLHHVLQRIVEEGTPVWRSFKESLCELALTSSRDAAKALPSQPTASPAQPVSATEGARAWDLGRHDAADPASRFSPVSPRVLWQQMQRSGVLEMTVANPANKTALFASPLPKLLAKPRAAVPVTPLRGKK